MAGLVDKPRARILHGHDWVFSSEVLKAFGNPADGEVISLKDGKDRLIGSAIYNSKSQIELAVSRGDGRISTLISFGAESRKLPSIATGEASMQNCAALCGAKVTVCLA